MDLDTLEAQVAAFFGKVVADFTINSVDLLLIAVNNAKRWAQLQYDFELCRQSVQVSVNTVTGGLLSSAVLIGTSTAVRVKKIEAAFLSYANGQRPVDFVAKKYQVSDLKRRYQGVPYEPERDTPLTAGSFISGVTSVPTIVQQGGTIFLYPDSTAVFSSGTAVIYLDVVSWLADYAAHAAANLDFFLEFGSEFLFWRTIVEVNHRFAEFVPRTEGNLPPPDRLVQQSFEALKVWDSSMTTANSTAFNLD